MLSGIAHGGMQLMKIEPISQTDILLKLQPVVEGRFYCWGCSKPRDRSERKMVGKAARCIHCWDKVKK